MTENFALQVNDEQHKLLSEYADKLNIANGQIAVIKATYASSLTENEFLLYMEICARTRLIPGRDIHAIKYKEKLSFQVSIDGLGKIAMATGQYDGCSIVEFCGKDGQWRDVWLEEIAPSACRVSVYRKDCKHPFVGIVLFSEYKGVSTIWQQKSCHMLAKCALAQALRRAFPGEMSGQYIQEEMESAEPERVKLKSDEVAIVSSPQSPTKNQFFSKNLIPACWLPKELAGKDITLEDLANNPLDYQFYAKDKTLQDGHFLLKFFATMTGHPLHDAAIPLWTVIEAKKAPPEPIAEKSEDAEENNPNPPEENFNG